MDQATLEHLIIKEIRKAREISRKDLADNLGIAKSTAGRRVDSMIERGIVQEIGLENSREVGRPRRFLAVRGDYGGFIGFDFDARHLYVVLIDFAQTTVVQKKIRLSPKPNRAEVLSLLRATITEFTANVEGLPVRGVGIGVPGHVTREARIGLHYPFIDGWKEVDLLKELGLTPEFLQIENNTRTVALGEYWLGSHAGAKHLLCLNVRTGISAAVIANGELLSGTREMAGEIRGWPVLTGDRQTHGVDCLESVATVRAVTAGGETDETSWNKFVSACREGQAEALKSLSRIAGYHGDTVSKMIQLLDPEVIFLAGPFTELEDLYLDRVRRATAVALLDHHFSPPPIKPATLGEFAGAHGAAALAAAESR